MPWVRINKAPPLLTPAVSFLPPLIPCINFKIIITIFPEIFNRCRSPAVSCTWCTCVCVRKSKPGNPFSPRNSCLQVTAPKCCSPAGFLPSSPGFLCCSQLCPAPPAPQPAWHPLCGLSRATTASLLPLQCSAKQEAGHPEYRPPQQWNQTVSSNNFRVETRIDWESLVISLPL